MCEAFHGLDVYPDSKRDQGGACGPRRTTTCSIRNTTVEAYLEASVQEIKVSRSDLLSNPKQPEKRVA